MKIYKFTKYYSIDRDDSELRVLCCPSCSHYDIEETNKKVRLTTEGEFMPLLKCNKCKKYFTFYPEDGKRDITEEEAKDGVKKGFSDMRETGEDNHGHGFYIPFKEEPPSITRAYCDKQYDGTDEDYERIGKEKESAISSRQIVDNIDLISSIDFDVIRKYKKAKK